MDKLLRRTFYVGLIAGLALFVGLWMYQWAGAHVVYPFSGLREDKSLLSRPEWFPPCISYELARSASDMTRGNLSHFRDGKPVVTPFQVEPNVEDRWVLVVGGNSLYLATTLLERNNTIFKRDIVLIKQRYGIRFWIPILLFACPLALCGAIRLRHKMKEWKRIQQGLCHVCGYPQTGLTGTQCPECGTHIPLHLYEHTPGTGLRLRSTHRQKRTKTSKFRACCLLFLLMGLILSIALIVASRVGPTVLYETPGLTLDTGWGEMGDREYTTLYWDTMEGYWSGWPRQFRGAEGKLEAGDSCYVVALGRPWLACARGRLLRNTQGELTFHWDRLFRIRPYWPGVFLGLVLTVTVLIPVLQRRSRWAGVYLS